MCSHAGRSNHKKPQKRLAERKDFNGREWFNVMIKGHQLAAQRQQQELKLDIQQESEYRDLRYPQSLLQLKQQIGSLKKQKTLKVKTPSVMVKNELSAAARLLHCKIEEVATEQYLYITRT